MGDPQRTVQDLIASITEHSKAITAERRRHGLKSGESLLAHLDHCNCEEATDGR